jgi:hypothetical protein
MDNIHSEYCQSGKDQNKKKKTQETQLKEHNLKKRNETINDTKNF